MGYKFQFITLAGIHSMWHGMFSLAKEYVSDGMTAYVKLQEKEFADAEKVIHLCPINKKLGRLLRCSQ